MPISNELFLMFFVRTTRLDSFQSQKTSSSFDRIALVQFPELYSEATSPPWKAQDLDLLRFVFLYTMTFAHPICF